MMTLFELHFSTTGILMSERESGDKRAPILCYFELHDLNIEQPVDLLDVVMLLNRMGSVKVQFQAQLIEENSKIPYCSNR